MNLFKAVAITFALTSFVSYAGTLQNATLLQKLAADPRLRPQGEPDGTFPSWDPHHPPPSNAPLVFQLSQSYPEIYDPGETFPWENIDVSSHPLEYVRAVLAYCLEGNVEVEFAVQKNSVRKWYHTPWLHNDGLENGSGREYLHGLTRERRAREFELHTLQGSKAQNWAIGFYNERGGYTVGKVWRTITGYPDPTQANFPPNTVTFKLLFTDAKVETVPFLANSFKWEANIYGDTDYRPPRVNREMRLLQVDVAVKEPSVDKGSGWVFGTFVYDASAVGNTVWERLVPVGISWGDDPTEKSRMKENGVFVNTGLTESRINSALVEVPNHEYGNRAYVRHYGLGGRLNGPIDNPVSSCISCHARAATYYPALPIGPNSGRSMPMAVPTRITKPSDFPEDQFSTFFHLIRGNSHLEKVGADTFATTDYSLQLSAGIRNFYQSLKSDEGLLRRLSAEGILDGDPKRLRDTNKLPLVTREID